MNTVSRIAALVKTVNPFAKQVKHFAKAHQLDIILAICMFLLSLLSFAAGYLTTREQLQEPITIESNEQSN